MRKLIIPEQNEYCLPKRRLHNRARVGLLLPESIEEVFEYTKTQNEVVRNLIFWQSHNMGNSKRRSWLGRDDFDYHNLSKFVHEPWREGIAAVEYALSKTSEQDVPASMLKRRRRYSEDGTEANADRFLAGKPDYMEDIEKQVTEGNRFISLLMTPSYHKNVPASFIFAQSAAIIANIDQLERQNIQVELYAHWRCSLSYPSSGSTEVLMPVKRLGEPLNIEAVVSLLSPWWFRLFILQLMMDFNQEFGNYCSHIGYAEDARDNVRQYLPAGTIDVPRAENNEELGKMFHTFADMITKGDGTNDDSDLN